MYNHPDARAHPWKWAVIHGAFVLAASVAGIASWRLNEGARALTDLVLNAAGEGIYVLDDQGRTMFANPASVSMLGWDAAALVSQPEPELVGSPPSGMAGSTLPGDAVLRNGWPRHGGSTTFRRKNGEEFPVDFVATPLSERGRVAGAVVTFNEITDRIKAEEALRTSEARFRMLFASNPHPMWVYDLETLAFLEVNEAAVTQYGYSREEFLAMRVADLGPAGDQPFLSMIDSSGAPAQLRAAKSRHQRKSREVFAVALTSHRLDFAERQAALIVAEDISERVRFEEQLAHQALHDALTGLPNQALFTDRLERAMASGQRDNSSVAVLFLDLDGFKVINDSLGHNVGDELLVSLSRRLSRFLRPEDTAARFGGDEFLVLLENLEQRSDAMARAEELLAAFRPPVLLLGREVFITASIGDAVHTPTAAHPRADDLVREADIAMYQAKASGRARAVLFDAGMDPPAVERLELETDLRRAVERDELALYYQPEVDLRTGDLVGMEALVRWQQPDRGLLLPADFIPIAEETGLIMPIGEWVLREACRQTQEWRSLRPDDQPLVIGVNLSARQIAEPTFVGRVAAILDETGLPASCLQLEITETTAMQDTDTTIAALRELRTLGVDVAIDDFGTGYSSLSYLQSLPVNILKIDRAFVRAVAEDMNAKAIVQAIIAVAHTLSMKVTAEGIETAQQLDQLAALDCEGGQGYYFAKPLAPEEFGELLSTVDGSGRPMLAA